MVENIPWKYHEAEILKELEEYLASTYKSHYVGNDNIQAMDLIIASGHGEGFCIGDIIKYAARKGKKKGEERKDILKILHYAIFLLHIHDTNEARKPKNEIRGGGGGTSVAIGNYDPADVIRVTGGYVESRDR